MKDSSKILTLSWLALVFAVAFIVIGVSYWPIPYSKIALPNTLWRPNLFLVVLGAALVRIFGGVKFWRATFIIGAVLPAVVMARVAFDAAHDPTSHNLWPFEFVIAAALGLMCSVPGSLIGTLGALAVKKTATTEPA